MTTRFNYSTVVYMIKTVLEENKAKTWPVRSLVREVASRTNTKNTVRIADILTTFVLGGLADGLIERGGRIRSIRWKAPDSPAFEGNGAETREMAAEIERLKKKLAELELAKAEERAKAKPQDRVIEVHLVKQEGTTKKVVKKTKGYFHVQFARILKLAEARMNIFIYGPTGCGKSHICHQVAEAMGLRFAFVSCTAGMSEGVLGGRLLPVGKQGTFEYVVSEFIDCYENGGVFLLDEIDAADPNVLLLVNAALANGHVAVPNRPAKPYATRHKDFVCIAAANTVGTGADRLYSGRNKLDAATLDRFQIGKIMMDYDNAVEEALCPDDNIRGRLLGYRKAIMAHRLERAMSTRFMRDAYKMVHEFGWTMEDVDAAFFTGWREDEVTKVRSYIA